jgi:hypothetical protein
MGILNFLKSNNDKQKSIRIKTEIGDKFVNLNLNQTYESLDILSLKIFQKDVYRLFDADYGIVVGRVIGSGIGIPNCRISIFVPIDEEPIVEPSTLEDIKKIEAASIYPYQTVYDKDNVGKIYNLLPKYSKNRNFNGFPDNNFGLGATPKTPVGTFAEKEEILSNETLVYVYDKYLKFTTLTNESGDYILTVPANKTYTVNMSCDITDIGRFSTCPALLKLEGYPDNFFSEDGTQINQDIPLEKLPNIDIQNQTITVKPLWSQNTGNSNVGINRLDFNLSKKIRPFITVVGNYFTHNNGSWWGDRIIFRAFYGLRNLCIGCPSGTALASGKKFGIGLKFRICISTRLFSWSRAFGFSKNLDPPLNPNCGDGLVFCLQIANLIPFFRIAGMLVNKYCQLNGGRNDYPAFGLINLGKTNVCNIDNALSVLDGLSDDLFIQSHQKGNIDLRVFNIKDTVPEEDAQKLNEEGGYIITGNNDPMFQKYSHEDDIELYPKDKYISYQNNGSFITLINCNRNKFITNEIGDLIPVDEKSEKGVFTSFRGYFYVTNDAPIDNPATRNRTGKIALKIPQLEDYTVKTVIPLIIPDSPTFYITINNPKFKWIWKHYKFDYGKIYSVAQKNDVNNADFDGNKEKREAMAGYDAAGFDEQTNILFVGAREENNEIINPVRDYNTNDQFKKYKDFYNHITLLGLDSNNTIDFTTRDGDSEDVSTINDQPTLSGIGIVLYRFGETTIIPANQRSGWNMHNNSTFYDESSPKLVKFRINLVVPSGYSIPPDKDKWNFTIAASSESQINRMEQDGFSFYGPNSDILFDIANVTPSNFTFVSSTDGAIFKFFDITIPLGNVDFFSRYHRLRAQDRQDGEIQNWILDAVLSDNYDDLTYSRVIIKTLDRDEVEWGSLPDYIHPPYNPA